MMMNVDRGLFDGRERSRLLEGLDRWVVISKTARACLLLLSFRQLNSLHSLTFVNLCLSSRPYLYFSPSQ